MLRLPFILHHFSEIRYRFSEIIAKKWFNGTFVSHDFNIQPVDTRLSINQDSKMRICQEAFQFIPEHAVIFIDAGSTALCFAQLLSQKSGYTVITNSIAAATS